MNIDRFFNKLDEIYAEKNPERTELYLSNRLCDARLDNDDRAIAIVCNELGGFFRAMGRYEEGEPLYKEAIDSLGRIGLFATEEHATTLLNFATNYAVWGKYEDAMEVFELASIIFNNLGITDDYRIATMHNNMSIMFQDMKQYDSALEHLNQALEILEKFENSDIEKATTYTNITQIKMLQKDIKGAFEASKMSVDLFNAANAQEDVHYSAAIETYGHLCMKLKHYEEALEIFEKVRDMTVRDYGYYNLAYKTVSELVLECKRQIRLNKAKNSKDIK